MGESEESGMCFRRVVIDVDSLVPRQRRPVPLYWVTSARPWMPVEKSPLAQSISTPNHTTISYAWEAYQQILSAGGCITNDHIEDVKQPFTASTLTTIPFTSFYAIPLAFPPYSVRIVAALSLDARPVTVACLLVSARPAHLPAIKDLFCSATTKFHSCPAMLLPICNSLHNTNRQDHDHREDDQWCQLLSTRVNLGLHLIFLNKPKFTVPYVVKCNS